MHKTEGALSLKEFFRNIAGTMEDFTNDQWRELFMRVNLKLRVKNGLPIFEGDVPMIARKTCDIVSTTP